MPLYSAFGLTLESEVPLPELIESTGEPAVSIRFGEVPAKLADPLDEGGFFQARPGAFLLNIPDIARYLVNDGREIVIDPETSRDSVDIRVFLLGSAFGALLQQRQLLTLHASSVQTPDGAVLFSGPSGMGKSTILAGLMQRGYPMLADDVTAVDCSTTEPPVAYPAFPRTRLWENSLTHLDYSQGSRLRVRDQLDKYTVPATTFCGSPQPVRAICCLGMHNGHGVMVEQIADMNRFTEIMGCTYRRRFVKALGLRDKHFAQVMSLANNVPVVQLNRSRDIQFLGKLLDLIEERIIS